MIRARRGAFWRKTGTFIAARLRACGWIGFFEVFGMGEMLDAETADFYFDTITDQLATEALPARAVRSL
jgi:glucuronate isomerase